MMIMFQFICISLIVDGTKVRKRIVKGYIAIHPLCCNVLLRLSIKVVSICFWRRQLPAKGIPPNPHL